MESVPGTTIAAAAAAIASARRIVISAGAGLGVDSGLPDFRGPEGFWRAYPPVAKLGLRFHEMSNPEWFEKDAPLAWGFWSHRTTLYRAAQPHEGYAVLRKWATRADACADAASGMKGHGVFTSNVDGQFLCSGFDARDVYECHGCTRLLQCTDAACAERSGPFPWAKPDDAGDVVPYDHDTLRADVSQAPTCAVCGRLARPNVMMFGDWSFCGGTYDAAERRLAAFVKSVDVARDKPVVVEMGAGTAIPTVRHFTESLGQTGWTVVRVNPREPEIPASVRNGISIAAGAKAALTAIDAVVDSLSEL